MKSFYYAFRGIVSAFRTERNLRVHLIAAIVVIAAGFYVQLSTHEWMMIVLCIGMVSGFELLNDGIRSNWMPGDDMLAHCHAFGRDIAQKTN